MKVRFVEDALVDGNLAFEKDSVHNLSDSSADRWIRRQKAVLHSDKEDSAVEKILEKVAEGVHVAAETIEKVLDAAIAKDGEVESSDAPAVKPVEEVAKPVDESENGKGNKKGNGRKGL